MIVQKEIDRDEVVEIANEIVAGIGQDITTLEAEVADHELRIDALERTALWSLTDVNMTLTPLEDQKIVYYNATSDRFELKIDAAGISDVPDSQDYTRSAGAWKLLDNTQTIIDIEADIQTNINDIAQIQFEVDNLDTDIINLEN